MPEETNDVQKQEEVVAPQAEQNPETAAETSQEVKQTSSDQNYNWKEMRKSRDELQGRVKDLENFITQSQEKQQPQEEEVKLAPDDLVEWRHVEKKIKKLDDKLQSYQQQSSLMTAESRLKSEYSDFDHVVTKDNVDLLKQTEPELAASLTSCSDVYTKGIAAYKLIKNLGLAKEDPYSEDRARAQQNAAKPRSTTSAGVQTGNTPISKANAFANGLTPELRTQLYKEMQEARKKSS